MAGVNLEAYLGKVQAIAIDTFVKASMLPCLLAGTSS